MFKSGNFRWLPIHMARFVLIPFLTLALLATACLLGGWWSVAALISVTALVAGLDRLVSAPPPEGNADSAGSADRLTTALGLAHLALMPLGVWALTANGRLEGAAAVVTALALGLFFGQVSNSNAHELIHRSARWPRRLGVAVYATLLFGHHASAHPKVHHVHVATPRDPNSAPLGMGFYHFWPRAWIGSFRAGLAAENRMRRAATGARGVHPYVIYVAGACLSLWIGWLIAGLSGVVIWLALASYAQMQLILSDYVQHYGLERARRADGGYEPAGPRHSWNAPQWYSSALMLNAPRHSDHHQNPLKTFPELELDHATMPMLPRSLPVMASIALIPPLWRRMMDKRARKWSAQDNAGDRSASLRKTAGAATGALGSAQAHLSH